MPKVLRLRRLSEEEEREITRLTRARTASVRLAARARIIALAQQDLRLPTVAADLGVSVAMVRRWANCSPPA